MYSRTGGHAYSSVYPGPIGAILTPQLAHLEQAESLPYASSLCGACYEVCPVKINIPEVLVYLRGQIVARQERTLKGQAQPRSGGDALAGAQLQQTTHPMSAPSRWGGWARCLSRITEQSRASLGRWRAGRPRATYVHFPKRASAIGGGRGRRTDMSEAKEAMLQRIRQALAHAPNDDQVLERAYHRASSDTQEAIIEMFSGMSWSIGQR